MNILILGCISSYSVERFIKAGNDLGVRIIFVFAASHKVRVDGLHDDNILQVTSLDTTHIRELEQAIKDLGIKIDSILPGGELVVPTVFTLSQRLDCCCAGPDILLFRHKLKMRQAIDSAGLPQPKVIGVFSSENEISDIEISYPVIVKPSDGAASFNVRKCDNEIELREGINAITRHKQSVATGVHFSGEALVETIAHGSEYSVEGVVQNGELRFIHAHRKALSPLPYFDEIGHVTLPGQEFESEILADALSNVVKTLGLITGVVHAEFRIEKEEARLIEIAARIGGDMIPDLTEFATGVSLEKAMIQIHLPNASPLLLEHKIERIVGIGFLFSDDFDIPEGLEVLKQGKAQAYSPIDYVSNYHVTRRRGYILFSCEEYGDAINYIKMITEK